MTVLASTLLQEQDYKTTDGGRNARVERDVALQHGGEAALLVLARRPEVHRARDVRCAAVVLRAEVDSQGQQWRRHEAP
jgi:hypothetical protein